MRILNAPAASGLFLVRDFLDPQACAAVRAEARAASGHPAPVYIEGAEGHVHEDVRKTSSLEVSAATAADVERRLLELREQVGGHFGLSLKGCEPPQFLRYGEGDFFVRHQDGDTEQLEFDHLRVRKVSVIVFLNGGASEPSKETFGGGELLGRPGLPCIRSTQGHSHLSSREVLASALPQPVSRHSILTRRLSLYALSPR